jgi:hypothetical protein
MSGTAAIKGFLLQGMYALTRILESDDWQTIKLESKTSLDTNGKEIPDRIDFQIDDLAIQVKHSSSQIGLSQIKKWCNEMKDNTPALEKELVVMGTFPSKIPKSHNHVKITLIGSDSPVVIQRSLSIVLQKYIERIFKIDVPSFMVRGIQAGLTYEIILDSALANSMGNSDFRYRIDKQLSENYPELITNKPEKLEELKFRLGVDATIQQANYEARRNACVQALDLLTRCVLQNIDGDPLNPQSRAKMGEFKHLKPTTREIIRIHNSLIVTVKNKELIALFNLIAVPRPMEERTSDKSSYINRESIEQYCSEYCPQAYENLKQDISLIQGYQEIALTDLLNEFRNLVRHEIGVSEERLPLDRERVIIA